MTDQASEQWYKKGLRFKCTGCGKCCTGGPGYVWVTKEEIAAMAEYLTMPIDLFVRKHIRQRDNRYALIEKKTENFDCIFLHDKKCLVYPVRPQQCKTFPWWKENLCSQASWNLAASMCEGINDNEPLFTAEEIEKIISNKK